MTATGSVSISFDNLGEAAEIELGAIAPDDPAVGSHPTVTTALPRILERLQETGVPATFFVEGLNTEIYPEALREITSRGHEVGFHAWRHEEWAKLPPDAQASNLERGLAGFAALGIEVAGMRPPGGGLGPGGLGILRGAGLRYCSPAGTGVGVDEGVALLPFDWRHVDATCVLPPLGPVREAIAGSPDPLAPDAVLAFLEAEVNAVVAGGGHLTIVCHPFMLDWWGERRLGDLLDRLGAAVRNGELEVETLATLAERVHSEPGEFPDPVALDATSWSG